MNLYPDYFTSNFMVFHNERHQQHVLLIHLLCFHFLHLLAPVVITTFKEMHRPILCCSRGHQFAAGAVVLTHDGGELAVVVLVHFQHLELCQRTHLLVVV